MDKSQKDKLAALVKDLQKKHGVESIQLFGQSTVQVNWVPVASPNLEDVLGRGYPRGRMIEIYGPESSGKTSLVCAMAADCQRFYFKDKQRYGTVAFIDVEHAFDPEYAKTFGFNVEDCLFSQPNSAEEALDLVEDLLASKLVDLIIVDSVAALTPQAEIDGNMGDSHMGLQARLMSQACRKLQCKMGPEDATVIFINQIRMKIGVMFGNPETTTGGEALKFYASIRLTIRKGEQILKGDTPIGVECKIKAIKNKVGTPYRTTTLKLVFGQGFALDEEYLMAFAKYELIERGGTGWYTFKINDKIAKVQGTPAATKFLLDNPAYYSELKVKLIGIKRKESEIATVAVVQEETEASEEAIQNAVQEQTALENEFLSEEDDSIANLAAAANPAGGDEKPTSEKKPGITKELVEATDQELEDLERKVTKE